MAKFNLGTTDFEDISDLYYRSGGSSETPEDLPCCFFLIKENQELSENESHQDIIKTFTESLCPPFDGINQREIDKVLEQDFTPDAILKSLHHSVQWGEANAGGLADSKEESSKLVQQMIQHGDVLVGLYCTTLAHSSEGSTNRPTLFHYSETSYFFVWKDRCALLTFIGWD